MTAVIATSSQRSEIEKHLNDGKTITPFQAFGLYSCLRLASVIFTLRQRGIKIDREIIVEKGHRVAQYKLG